MAKTKTPFFGLGSHGSVGNAITTQHRSHYTLVRTKPVPTYRQTLPQLYQRWLYEDYSYLWRQQTAATRQAYATAGSRYHLTGFQYWMKYNLTNLPDILGMWYLDVNTTPTTPDTSRLDNPMDIIGASPVDAVIDQALSFDGTNDYCSAPYIPAYDETLCYECFFYPTDSVVGAPTYRIIFAKDVGAREGLYIDVSTTPNNIQFRLSTNGFWSNALYYIPAYAVWYHLVAQFQNNRARLFVNGSFISEGAVLPAPPLPNTQPLTLAGKATGRHAYCRIDHAIIRNRTLDDSEILRHSERRYPL